MSETELTIPTPDGEIDAHLYRPASGSGPGVLFLTDIMGIRPENLGMAKRLADEGFVVLVPNVFYRTSKPPVFPFPINFGEERTMKRFGELAAPLTPDAIARDVTVLADYLHGLEGVAKGKIGVVGYCFTGAIALRMAASEPERIGAAASFHGGGLYTSKPDSPHTVLPQVKAELYFGHAVNDQSIPAEAIAKLEDSLAAWGGRFESETYEGALHGWTVPGRSGVYHHEQAERAHEKLVALFRRSLP